jgi:hypothetical protein
MRILEGQNTLLDERVIEQIEEIPEPLSVALVAELGGHIGSILHCKRPHHELTRVIAAVARLADIVMIRPPIGKLDFTFPDICRQINQSVAGGAARPSHLDILLTTRYV